jgi:hypothetical protein
VDIAIPDIEISTTELLKLIGQKYTVLNKWLKNNLISFQQPKNWYKEFTFQDALTAVVVNESLKLKDNFETAKRAGKLVKEKLAELEGKRLDEVFIIITSGGVVWGDKKVLTEYAERETVTVIPVKPIVKRCLKFVNDLFFDDKNWELIESK